MIARLRTSAAVIAALGVILGAGCIGGDDDDDDAAATTTVPVTTESVATSDPELPVALTFGVLAPGANGLAELAAGQQRGIALALEDIAAAGGVLGGGVATVRRRRVRSTSPSRPRSSRSSEQGANAILGPVGSATALEVAAMRPGTAAARLLGVGDGGVGHLREHRGVVLPHRDARRRHGGRRRRRDHGRRRRRGGRRAARRTSIVLGRDDVYGVELAGDLSAQLTARGATVDTIQYPSRASSSPRRSRP